MEVSPWLTFLPDIRLKRIETIAENRGISEFLIPG